MRHLDENGFLLHIPRLHVTSLYRAYREVCAPPMLNISSVPEGDIWYHSLPGIVACLADQSLVVAYASKTLPDTEIANLRVAQNWLMGRCADAPNARVRFAAREEPTGQLTVKRLLMGDWAGFPYRAHLPPSEKPSR